jgi:PsbP-like protein
MMNNYAAIKTKLMSCCRTTTIVIIFFLGLSMVGTVSVAASSVSNSSQVGGQELQGEQQQQQGEWLLYQNVTYGVSMLYPSNWTQQNSTGDVDDRFIGVSNFFSPEEETDGYFAQVRIAINRMPQTTSIESYRSQSIDIYRQDPKFQEFQLLSASMGNFTLAGMPAYSFEIAYTDLEFGPQNILEVGRIFDNRVYYIQYFADPPIYQKYLPIAERMIESFQIMQQQQQ